MALTQLTDNLNIHQSLPDQPALTATELKQKFDEAANKIKTYINETLTTEIDTLIAALQGTDTSLSNALTTAQATLSQAVSDITAIQTTLNGLKSGATTKITIGSSAPVSLDNGEVYLQYF